MDPTEETTHLADILTTNNTTISTFNVTEDKYNVHYTLRQRHAILNFEMYMTAVVSPIGIFLNFLSMLVFLRSRSQNKSVSICLVAVSIADMMSLVGSLLTRTARAATGGK